MTFKHTESLMVKLLILQVQLPFIPIYLLIVLTNRIFLRGNKDGTPTKESVRIMMLFHLKWNDGEMHFIGDDPNYWAGTGNYNDPYEDRVQGAPYFFAFNTDQINTPDFIPIDTARYTIWVPELNDTGRIYTPLEALNIADVEPIKTEKIQTIEIGFKGFLSEKIHATIDYYTSFYEDFFSAPTVITPLVIERKWSNGVGSTDVTNMDNISVVGLLPVNDFLSNPPYGTQWNGNDDDNDWSSNISMPFFNNNLTTINSEFMNLDLKLILIHLYLTLIQMMMVKWMLLTGVYLKDLIGQVMKAH